LRGVGAAPRAGARAAISETKGRRSLRLGAAHASAAADLNVSRGRAARRDMREGSSRSLGREESVSAQSLWKRAREGGIRGLDIFVADARYVLAVLEKQGGETGRGGGGGWGGDERRRRSC
jgi:hypothetical protein